MITASLVSISALAAAGASARWNWWRLPRRGIPILMYHKVGVPPKGSKLKKLWVSPDRFREQLDYITKNGYQPITFADIYAHLDSNRALPPKPVMITFDDGYANNFTEAYPILTSYGFRATIFVVVNTVGGDNVWHNPETETRIPMISWDQIQILKQAGWEIGSHTLSHHNLTRVSLSEAKEQINRSRVALGLKLGANPLTLAYPYGAGEDVEAIRNLAKEAGYRIAVGVHAGKWKLKKILSNAFQLPRVFVRGDDTMYDFHLQMTRGQSRL